MVTLYHQDANLKFSDITKEAGLTRKGWGMGIAVADYDNDGLPDIYAGTAAMFFITILATAGLRT